jgi:non-ribosomal peptide synthetase component E (peptide arylation enzyme)
LLGLDMIRPSRGRPEDVALLPFSLGQDGRLRSAPVTHSDYGQALDRADEIGGFTCGDLALAMPPAGDGLAYAAFIDCALLRGTTVVAVRKQELAMAAVAHQATVAIVPRDALPVVPGRIRALPVD